MKRIIDKQTLRDETTQKICEHAAVFFLMDSGQEVNLEYARHLGFLRWLVISEQLGGRKDAP